VTLSRSGASCPLRRRSQVGLGAIEKGDPQGMNATMNAPTSTVAAREHSTALFAGGLSAVLLTITIIAEVMGPGRWSGGLNLVSSYGLMLASLGVAAAWAGTYRTAMARGAGWMALLGTLVALLLNVSGVIMFQMLGPDTYQTLFRSAAALALGGGALAFVSMALESKVLASDPVRFVALLGAAGCAVAILGFFDVVGSEVARYGMMGGAAVALLVFGLKARNASDGQSRPEMEGWDTALSGAELFKNALTWLITFSIAFNVIAGRLKDRDALMWAFVGALVVNAVILVIAARGAAKFRRVPARTGARGAANAAFGFTFLAAGMSVTNVALGAMGIFRVPRGLNFEEVVLHISPTVEMLQSLMWIAAVLSLMAAFFGLGRSMKVPALTRASVMGMLLFGLGALANLTVRASNASFNAERIDGTMVIIGLVGLVVLLAGLVYVFKALGQAGTALASGQGQQIAEVLD